MKKKQTAKSLEKMIDSVFAVDYVIHHGKKVPSVNDLPLGNYGRIIDVSILFVDIRCSTRIVSAVRHTTAAKMFRSFMTGISKIVIEDGGKIRAFNGDGILIVFYGENGPIQAVKSAGRISWFLSKILKKKLDKIFSENEILRKEKIHFDYGIGIDHGEVLVVRGGERGIDNSDLVWVGNTPNFAAKISHLSGEKSHICITKNIYQNLTDDISKSKQRNIWKKIKAVPYINTEIYKSDFKGVIE